MTHPVFGYKMSYGRMLEVQARMLAAHVRGDIPRYVGFTTVVAVSGIRTMNVTRRPRTEATEDG